MLGTEELIQIRRHLHQIPELALQETETHAYLMEVIGKMEQDHLEILEPGLTDRHFGPGERYGARPNDWLPHRY